ncbi:MAG: hypothetical protein KAJ33_01425 [Thermoplasmata archaeon]|nr:hypothetical protein [Thermoplasmata archaeon]
MMMEITRDRLHLLTGILALAFGVYCFIIGIGAAAFGLVDMSLLLLMFCFIFAFIYIILGIFALRTKPGGMSSFMGIGLIVGTYWWGSGGIPWFMWPMIIMPIVILVLTILILFRAFSGKRRQEWE